MKWLFSLFILLYVLNFQCFAAEADSSVLQPAIETPAVSLVAPYILGSGFRLADDRGKTTTPNVIVPLKNIPPNCENDYFPFLIYNVVATDSSTTDGRGVQGVINSWRLTTYTDTSGTYLALAGWQWTKFTPGSPIHSWLAMQWQVLCVPNSQRGAFTPADYVAP